MSSPRVNYDQMIKLSTEYRTLVNWFADYARENNFEDNRRRSNIIIKHSFFTAARELSGLSLDEIGSILNKDHATVIHANKNHKSNLVYLPTYREVYAEIYTSLRGLFHSKDIEYDVDKIENVNELRHRLISVSNRLRKKIIEYNDVKTTQIDRYNALKKFNQELLERNDKLNAELLRMKNLV